MSFRPSLVAISAVAAVATVLLGAAGTTGIGEDPARRDPAAGRGLTLLVSGATQGELLPCGCVWAAIGGLSRRATAFLDLAREASEDEAVFIDLGNVLGFDPIFGPIQSEAQGGDMRRLGYSLIAVGAEDAYQGVAELRRLAERSGARLLSANLVYHDSGEPLYQPYALVGGEGAPRVALLGLTRWDPALLLAGERNRTVLLTPPEEAAARWIPVARREADAVVVFGDLRRHEANEILRKHPEILAILVPGFNVEHEGPLLGEKGVLSLADEGQQVMSFRIAEGGSTRAHYLTLTEELQPHPEVESWLQPFLDRINQSQRDAYRDVEPQPLHERFTGAERCRDCHLHEYESWSHGPHGGAFDTLVTAQREWFTECNLCHVTAAGDELVWLDPARTPHYAGVQCESCHDGGREHADHPEPGFGAVDPLTCERPCHRESADPDFDLEEAWQKLHHARPAD